MSTFSSAGRKEDDGYIQRVLQEVKVEFLA